MASPSNLPEPKRGGPALLPAAVALVPVLALTAAIPLVNRLEPRILGLPFLLAWIVGWIFLTPVFMLVVHRLHQRPR